MQNIMRIARAISKRRKDSVALEVGDLAEAFWYVDFVDRRSLSVLCRWLGLEAGGYGSVRPGGQSLVAEGVGLILPLSKVLRDRMETLPFSLDNIVGQPSDGAVNSECLTRWLLTQELHGQTASKPIVTNTVVRAVPAAKPQPEPVLPRPLREQLSEVVFGQDDLIDEVLGALNAHERDATRLPLVLFAAGPNASGKTLLAHLLGKVLSGYAFRTFEMSNYNSPEDFGLTGLRYGYANAHPGELTSFVRHNPRSIVVFENIERAHPVIQHTLVPAISHGVLRDQYWAGLADRGMPKEKVDVLDGMFGKAREDKQSGVADPDVSFDNCILIFTTCQGEAAYDLPIYNERTRMRVAERAAMLVDALHAAKEADERSIASGLLNALAEAVLLPFRRLDTPPLVRLAQARLREAAERWRNTHRTAVRIEQFEQMAELYLLNQGCRATPRSLTVRAAEDFLFGWQVERPVNEALKRVTLAMNPESLPGFAEFRSQLGTDPILTLFRKHQVVSFVPHVVAEKDGCRVLFGDFRVVTGKRAFDVGGQGGIQAELPSVSFADVVGHEKAKQRLRQAAALLARRSELEKFKVECPRGLLLYGPPGTGKTMLAKAFACEADLPFISVTGTELMDPDFIRKLFDRLRRYAPAVLFVDEIDAIGRRGQSVLGDAVINQLLAEIDGFAGSLSEPLFVIAATNFPDKLDAALLRSGRIDLHVEVPPLNEEARRLFIERYRAIPGLAEIELERVLNATGNLSGADLEKARREVVLEMARSERATADEVLLLSKLAEIKHGETRDVECSDEELERNAFHEAGHAVIARLLLPEQVIERVSIEIRGEAVGGVSFAGGKPRVDNLDAALVRKRLSMLLAGRMAEMKRFGEAGCNAGAASDLRQATELAGRAVMSWGLDKSLGPLSFVSTDGTLPAPANTPAWALKRIRAWLDQAEIDTQVLLDEHWAWIQTVASRLMEKQTLSMVDLAPPENGSSFGAGR